MRFFKYTQALCFTLCVLHATQLVAESVGETLSDEQNHYEMAKTAWYAEKENEAFIHVKNALQQQPDHIPSLILMSELFFSAGNIPAARTTLEKGAALGADINLILPLLGTVYILEKDLDALQLLAKNQTAFSKRSQFEWALLLGQRELLSQEPELARAHFESAYQMFPEDTRAMNTLAQVYLRFSDYQRADALIDQSLAINDRNERTWVLKGEAAEARGRWELAITYYLTAFDLDSDDPKTLRLLAANYLRKKDYPEVQKFLNIILDQSPYDPNANLIQAGLLLNEGKTKDAHAILATLSDNLSSLDIKDRLSDASLIYIQGVADHMRGNEESAKKNLTDYLATRPDDVEAIRLLFTIYRQNEENFKAVALLEDKQRVIAKDLDLSVQLASLYIRENKYLKTEQLLAAMGVHFSGHPVLSVLEARLLHARGLSQEALDLLLARRSTSFRPLPTEVMIGQLYLEQNQLEAASVQINALVDSFPNEFDVLVLKAGLHLRKNEFQQALAVINLATNRKPEDAGLAYNRALALNGLGNDADAVTALKQVLVKHPEHLPSMMLLARIALKRGDVVEAHDWVGKVLAQSPANESALFFQYQIFSGEGNGQSALASIEKLLQLKRLDPVYLSEYAATLIQLQRYSELDGPLNMLYSLWSADAEKLVSLAELQVRAGRLEAGIASLEKALKIQPASDAAKLGMVQIYIARNELAEAEKWLSRVSHPARKSVHYLVREGDIARLEGKNAAALVSYFAAHDLDPHNRLVLVHLYDLTKTGDQFSKFSARIEKQLEGVSDPWLSKLLADAYLTQHRFLDAQRHYERLMMDDRFSSNLSLINNLANIYARDDLAKAIAFAEPALKGGQKSFALLDTVGWLLVRDGRFSDGLAYLREAYSMNSGSGEVRYHIGKALIGLNREKEALAELLASLDSGDDFEGRSDAKVWVNKLQSP